MAKKKSLFPRHVERAGLVWTQESKGGGGGLVPIHSVFVVEDGCKDIHCLVMSGQKDR